MPQLMGAGRRGVRRIAGSIGVAAVLVVANACGGEASPGADGGAPPTVTRVVSAAPVTVTESAPAPAPESPRPSAETAPAADTVIVPDVVGVDHQLAQDTMQAAGLYLLAEEDATGQGRLLLWDRNWIVVSQDPIAGTRVSADALITLRSRKDGE